MFVFANDLKTLNVKDGKWTCKDYFKVTGLRYDGDTISYVQIRNEKTGGLLEFGNPTAAEKQKPIGKVKAKALEKICNDKGIAVEKLLERYNVERLEDLTEQQHIYAVNALEKSNGNDR